MTDSQRENMLAEAQAAWDDLIGAAVQDAWHELDCPDNDDDEGLHAVSLFLSDLLEDAAYARPGMVHNDGTLLRFPVVVTELWVFEGNLEYTWLYETDVDVDEYVTDVLESMMLVYDRLGDALQSGKPVSVPTDDLQRILLCAAAACSDYVHTEDGILLRRAISQDQVDRAVAMADTLDSAPRRGFLNRVLGRA